MASEAQTSANRRNAEKSTGPRTEEGKTAVALNALKHGLSATLDVVCWEEQAEYEQHRETVLGELVPVGVMEGILAERVVSLTWRIRRAQFMQQEVVNFLIADRKASPVEQLVRTLLPKDKPMIESPRSDPQFIIGKTLSRDWANELILDRMNMYERRIKASLYRTMNELHKWRMMRKLQAEEGETGIAAPARQQVRGVRVGAGFKPAPTALHETPYGVTTSNCAEQSQFEETADSREQGAGRREVRRWLCKTKPISSGGWWA